jgi:dihydroorotase
MNLQINNARIIDPFNGIDEINNLFVEAGTIVAKGYAPADFVADRSLDCSDQIVIPGLIDLAARLREPGHDHVATAASETRAAAASGITTLCCPPDMVPSIDSPAEVKLIQQRAKAAGFCRVHPIGALTQRLEGLVLSEMAALKQAGCVGISNALRSVGNALILRRAMEYAASQELTIFLHPLDHALVDHGCAHEGATATRLGLPGIPSAAETAAVGHQLALIELTGVRAHFCRLSTARAVRMIARAKYDGLPITADVCAHQLFLTDTSISDFNTLCHTMPPLRTQDDLTGLRDGVASGAVTAICSDHQPHALDAKRAPFAVTEPGISALDTLLPLTLRLVDEGVLSLPDAIARVTSGPASVIGMDAGTISIGHCADLCIFNPKLEWKLTQAGIHSWGKNTPFLGWRFFGLVTYTILNGRIVYEKPADNDSEA